MHNYPYDRHRTERDEEGRQITYTLPGESLADTARRIEDQISRPPDPPPPIVPLEDRDPDAPEGWYDDGFDQGAWAAFAAQSGLASELT